MSSSSERGARENNIATTDEIDRRDMEAEGVAEVAIDGTRGVGVSSIEGEVEGGLRVKGVGDGRPEVASEACVPE